MAINVNQLVVDVKNAASQVIGQDIAILRGFSERQVKALALQTELISAGILSGGINEDLRDFFLDSLEDMALNFAKTLRGLLLVTIEKVWNAIVRVLWEVLAAATGIDLVLPTTD